MNTQIQASFITNNNTVTIVNVSKEFAFNPNTYMCTIPAVITERKHS